MSFLVKFLFSGAILATTLSLFAASPGPSALPGASTKTIPPVVYPSKPPPPKEAIKREEIHLEKPQLPQMDKPFGMPGVVGLRNGKWEGTDYLGYLGKNISVDIEILKGDNATVNVDTAPLQSMIHTLLEKEGIIPRAEVSEGPPLPFLHLLVIIYPIDKDRFVVFSTCRLFEEIQVVRKNFKPAGFWQGITWENQDISLATTDQLSDQVKSSLESLIKAFIERYKLYNKEGGVSPQLPTA